MADSAPKKRHSHGIQASFLLKVSPRHSTSTAEQRVILVVAIDAAATRLLQFHQELLYLGAADAVGNVVTGNGVATSDNINPGWNLQQLCPK